MKTYIFTVAFAATTLVAIGNAHTSNNTIKAASQFNWINSHHANPIDNVIINYLHVKNALTADNSKEAAKASELLKTALTNLGKENLDDAQKKNYNDIANDAIENADHIAKSGDNIKNQRAQFENLSNSIYEMIKVFGTSQTLYKDYCPMKKVSWLSEEKNIKNPYYGKSMLTCGIVKETFDKQ